jgi:hypothetical protein
MDTFVIRIVIDTEEDIFRDIEIRGDQTFEDLHDSIIHAFEFEGDQMASFYMSNEEWEKGKEIGLMDLSSFDGDEVTPCMGQLKISEEIETKNQKVLYVYDFLKMWVFYCEVIAINQVKDEMAYPAITREFGGAPDENSKDAPDLMEGEDLSKESGGYDEDDEFSDDPFDEFDDTYEDYSNYDDL